MQKVNENPSRSLMRTHLLFTLCHHSEQMRIMQKGSQWNHEQRREKDKKDERALRGAQGKNNERTGREQNQKDKV